MKKFDVTTVENLQPGDRFYFVAHSHKTIYELVEQKPRFNGHFMLSSIVKNTKNRQTEHVKKGREVVFLRNINQ